MSDERLQRYDLSLRALAESRQQVHDYEDMFNELNEERVRLREALKEVYGALKSEANIHHKGVWGEAWMAKADIEALLK